MKKITLFVILLQAAIFSAGAVGFAGGTGTESDPYQIKTADQLNEVRNNMTAHFILMNDIDLVASGYTVWLPIGKPEGGGNSFEAFFGVFDGGGHVVSNLNIMYDGNYVGFFGVVGGKVLNLGVKGQLTAGVGYGHGLLAGYLGQAGVLAEITNCYAEGTVTVTASGGTGGAGLLLGALTNAGGVSGCCSKGVVIAPELNWVGGLIGRMMHNTCFIFDCYSEATVTGGVNVGGLVGRIYGDQSKKHNAKFLYATGKVMGQKWVGGVAGDFYNVKAVALVAANPSVTATGSDVARVAPVANGDPDLEEIYGLSATEVKIGSASQTVVSDDTGKDGKSMTLAQLQDPELYEEVGWDMEETWEMPATAGLPILQWQKDMSTNLKKALAGEPFTVYPQGKIVHVCNIEAGSDICIYNISGQLVRQQKSRGESDTVLLTQAGVYLVKVVGANVSGSAKVVCK